MNRKDWTLLAISAANGEPLTPVQLQKSLFLLGKVQGDDVGDDFYSFEPYNYGPFDLAIYKDAEELAREGFVRIDREEPGRSYSLYAPTPIGLARAAEIAAPAPAKEYLLAVVAWARRLSFRDLVSAIYAAYPDQRVNSVFRG